MSTQSVAVREQEENKKTNMCLSAATKSDKQKYVYRSAENESYAE